MISLGNKDFAEREAMLNDAQTKSDTLASQVVGYAKQQREGYGYAKSFTGKELVGIHHICSSSSVL